MRLVLEGLERRAGLAPGKDGSAIESALGAHPGLWRVLLTPQGGRPDLRPRHRWFEDLVAGRAASFTEIASRVGVHPR
jgi:hypothetical protein